MVASDIQERIKVHIEKWKALNPAEKKAFEKQLDADKAVYRLSLQQIKALKQIEKEVGRKSPTNVVNENSQQAKARGKRK